MTMSPSPPSLDLLQERRRELGLPEPAVVAGRTRRNLLQGVVIGAAVAGVGLGVGALVALRAALVAGQIERLAVVEAEVEQFEARLRSERAALSTLEEGNKALVERVLAVRSGSALLRDLQLRVPAGIQLTEVREQNDGKGLVIKGLARRAQPFAAINALQLELKRSPLLDPNAVTLAKAAREQQQNEPAAAGPAVSFELAAQFRPPIQPQAELQILEELGSAGLAERLALLQKEGLLP